MKDDTEIYGSLFPRHESEDADSCFAGQNLALIRTWTTQQRRLEYASIKFEQDDTRRGMRLHYANLSFSKDYSHNNQHSEKDFNFLKYREDLAYYIKRIRTVMKELDGDILGIEIEERERIGGVFVPGVKS